MLVIAASVALARDDVTASILYAFPPRSRLPQTSLRCYPRSVSVMLVLCYSLPRECAVTDGFLVLALVSITFCFYEQLCGN